MRSYLLFAVCMYTLLVESNARTEDKSQTLRKNAVEKVKNGDCKNAIPFYSELLELESGQVQDDFNNLAVCLHQEGRYEEAEAVFNKGLTRYYHSEKLHLNKGVLLEEWAAKEARSRQLKFTPEIDSRSYNATQHLTFSLRLRFGQQYEYNKQRVPPQNRIGMGKLTVAILCHRRDDAGLGAPEAPVFGPKSQDVDGTQPAGHEESIPFLARHLVRDPLSSSRPACVESMPLVSLFRCTHARKQTHTHLRVRDLSPALSLPPSLPPSRPPSPSSASPPPPPPRSRRTKEKGACGVGTPPIKTP